MSQQELNEERNRTDGGDEEPNRNEPGNHEERHAGAPPANPQQRNLVESTDQAESLSAIFRTIRLVVLSFSALFAIVIGLFTFLGWRTASDVQSTVETTVEQTIGSLISKSNDEVTGLSKEIRTLESDFDRARQKVGEIEGGVAFASDRLQLTLQGQTDPVGDYQRLLGELQEDEEKLLDAETRKEAEIIFSKLLGKFESQGVEPQDPSESNIARTHVLAEVLYNAAGTASQFEMAKLASGLAKAANNGRNTPEHAARMYRAMIQAEEIEPEQGYNEVISLINSLDVSSLYSLHFVLSEAFNIAYSSGRLRELNEVLESVKTKLGDDAPSYVSILQAVSGLLLGSRSDVQRSIVVLRDGLSRANWESPNAWWMAATISSANEVVFSLLKHPSYRLVAEDIGNKYNELLAMKVEGDGQELVGILSPSTREASIGNMFFEIVGETSSAPSVGLTALELGVAVIISGDVEAVGNGLHWFAFKPSRTSTYRASAISSGPLNDPLVIVKDEHNEYLGGDDDGGGDLSARLELRLDGGKVYAVGVGSATNATVQGASIEIIDVEKH